MNVQELRRVYRNVRFSHLTTVDKLNKLGDLTKLYIPGHLSRDDMIRICRLSQHPQSKYTYKAKGCGFEVIAIKFDFAIDPALLIKRNVNVFSNKAPLRMVNRRFAYWKNVRKAA